MYGDIVFLSGGNKHKALQFIRQTASSGEFLPKISRYLSLNVITPHKG